MTKRRDHYAILVAINWYPGIGPLKGPENDAEEFKKWLMDAAGGNVDETTNIKVIRSSDFVPPAIDPDDANPTETQLKKVLNAWLRPDGNWRGRVGERLYLFFAGHGFTAGSLNDPAIFTAQARLGDTVHIAGYRYASKIQNAGFFDEIVLIMDCCQDVLKAAQVTEPTWSPPDNLRTGQVKLMTAFGAPRGKKAFETRDSPHHGYFSSVFMEALRTAPADNQGFVMARAVHDTFSDIWATRYLKLTGYEPPINPPKDFRLYRRNVPAQTSAPGPNVGGPNPVSGPASPAPDGSAPEKHAPERYQPNAPSSVPPHSAQVELSTQDPGAQIQVFGAASRHTGVGSLELELAAGDYTARFRLGDEVRDQAFKVSPGASFRVMQGPLHFSSPIPLEDTSTTHEYQHYPAMDLSIQAAQRAANAEILSSVGTLVVFARDSAHPENEEWAMSPDIRRGLRLRRLDETGLPRIVPCEPVVDTNRGYCHLLLDDLIPGTYLLGVRRLQQSFWSWQEIALTIAPSWWRTEVYLDCIDDDWIGRRFDIETASVLIVAGREANSLADPEARLTEIARLALSQGRPVQIMSTKPPEPMRALYMAYSLTLSPAPDFKGLQSLCTELQQQWTDRSADVKLLQMWCAAKQGKSEVIAFAPDEVPVFARGWKLASQLDNVRLPLIVQFNVGAWRMSGSIWTQTQVPDIAAMIRTQDRSKATFSRFAEAQVRERPEARLTAGDVLLSPLQHILRRALIDASESGELFEDESIVEAVARDSGLDTMVVRQALATLTTKHPAAAAEPHTEPMYDTKLYRVYEAEADADSEDARAAAAIANRLGEGE